MWRSPYFKAAVLIALALAIAAPWIIDEAVAAGLFARTAQPADVFIQPTVPTAFAGGEVRQVDLQIVQKVGYAAGDLEAIWAIQVAFRKPVSNAKSRGFGLFVWAPTATDGIAYPDPKTAPKHFAIPPNGTAHTTVEFAPFSEITPTSKPTRYAARRTVYSGDHTYISYGVAFKFKAPVVERLGLGKSLLAFRWNPELESEAAAPFGFAKFGAGVQPGVATVTFCGSCFTGIRNGGRTAYDQYQGTFRLSTEDAQEIDVQMAAGHWPLVVRLSRWFTGAVLLVLVVSGITFMYRRQLAAAYATFVDSQERRVRLKSRRTSPPKMSPPKGRRRKRRS